MRFRYSLVRASIAGSFVFPIHATLIFMGISGCGPELSRPSGTRSVFQLLPRAEAPGYWQGPPPGRNSRGRYATQAFPDARTTSAPKRISPPTRSSNFSPALKRRAIGRRPSGTEFSRPLRYSGFSRRENNVSAEADLAPHAIALDRRLCLSADHRPLVRRNPL